MGLWDYMYGHTEKDIEATVQVAGLGIMYLPE